MQETRQVSTAETLDPPTPSKIKKTKNPRRFSDDQVRALESIFEERTKLEPVKKVELAKDLGLHPRQVAIWFQNKRARWKSRQLEQEYNLLGTKYDALRGQFDDLKRENESLQKRLHELIGLMKNANLHEFEECDQRSNQGMDFDDATNSERISNKLEDQEFLGWGEEEEISHLGSPEAWHDLSICGLFDQSPSGVSSSNWWES